MPTLPTTLRPGHLAHVSMRRETARTLLTTRHRRRALVGRSSLMESIRRRMKQSLMRAIEPATSAA